MIKEILKMDWFPGKRGAGKVRTPKKGYTACNDAMIEEDRTARSCGRRKKGQNAKGESYNKLSFWLSNGDDMAGKLCGIGSVIASAKRLNIFAKRKLPSQLKFYPSKTSQSRPQEEPEPTPVSAAGSSSTPNTQCRSKKGSRHSQKNPKKSNLICGTPSASLTGDPAASKPTRTCSEGESSLSIGGQNTTPASHASASTTGISPGLDGNTGTGSVPAQRLIDGNNGTPSSEQNRINTLPAVGTPQIHIQGQNPQSVPGSCNLPNTSGCNPSCTVPSTSRQSEFSRPLSSNRLPTRPSNRRQSGFAGPLSCDILPARPSTGGQSEYSGILSSGRLPTGPNTSRQSGFAQRLSCDRLLPGPSTHREPEITPPLGNDSVAIRAFINMVCGPTDPSYNGMLRSEASQQTAVLQRLEEYQELTPGQIRDAEWNLFLDLVTSHDGNGATGLDIDHMSYEELLILEERMGTVSTGISTEALCASLRESRYKAPSEAPTTELGGNTDDIKCSICQEEYVTNDLLGSVIRCQHAYHLKCINQWLQMKNWCPICRVSVAPSKHSSLQMK